MRESIEPCAYTDEDPNFRKRKDLKHFDSCNHSGQVDSKSGVTHRFIKECGSDVHINGAEGYVHGHFKRLISKKAYAHRYCSVTDSVPNTFTFFKQFLSPFHYPSHPWSPKLKKHQKNEITL